MSVHIGVGRPIPVALCDVGGVAPHERIDVSEVEDRRGDVCERCLARYDELSDELSGDQP